MDQGRGFGKGLGLGPPLKFKCGLVFSISCPLGLDLGLASGDGDDFFSRLANFDVRRPTMEPPPDPDPDDSCVLFSLLPI